MINGIDFSELRFASSASRRRRRRRRQQAHLKSSPAADQFLQSWHQRVQSTCFEEKDLKSAIKNFETNLQGASESDRYNALNRYYNAVFLLPYNNLRFCLIDMGDRVMSFLDSFGYVKSMETALPGVPKKIVEHQTTIEYTLVNMPDSDYKALWIETLQKSGNPFLKEIAQCVQFKRDHPEMYPMDFYAVDLAKQLNELCEKSPEMKTAILDYYGTGDHLPQPNAILSVIQNRAIKMVKQVQPWWQKLFRVAPNPDEVNLLTKTMVTVAAHSGQGICPEMTLSELLNFTAVAELIGARDMKIRFHHQKYHLNPQEAKAELKQLEQEKQQFKQTLQVNLMAVSAEKLDKMVQDSLKAIQDPNLAKLLAQSEETRYHLLAQAEPLQKENWLEPYLKEAREKK